MPRIVALVKFFVAMVIGYSVLNKTDPVTTSIMLLEKIASIVPHPKKFSEWTNDERERWYKNAGGLDSDRAQY